MGITVNEAIALLNQIKLEHGGHVPLFVEFITSSGGWEEPVDVISIGKGDGSTRVLFSAEETTTQDAEDGVTTEQLQILEPASVTATAVQPGLDHKLRDRLGEMWNSGDSQQFAIAECLLMISDNDDDSATLNFMQTCAEELRDSAQSVIDFIQQRKSDIAAQSQTGEQS